MKAVRWRSVVLGVCGVVLTGCQATGDPVSVSPLKILASATGDQLPSAVVGIAYDQRLAATGGNGQYQWSISRGALPRNLTLSPSGVLSGTPADSGSVSFSVAVSSGGLMAEAPMTLTTISRLVIATEALPRGTVGLPYRAQLLTLGAATAGVQWTIARGRLPDGLTLSPEGLLLGTPLSRDSTQLTFEAASGSQLASRSLVLSVGDPAATVLSGQVSNLMSDSRRIRKLLIPASPSLTDSTIYVALSPDIPSDSLTDLGGGTASVALRLSALTIGTGTADSLAAYRRTQLPSVTFTSPYLAPERKPSDSLQFCGFDAGSCTWGTLVYLDSAYAYYEDRNLPSDARAPREWYDEVARVNAITDPLLRRIWGIPTDVDGNRRINILMSGTIGQGGFSWLAPCLGPGPPGSGARGCNRTPVQEWFYAGAVSSAVRTRSIRSTAGFFAVTQSTDAHEYIRWTQGIRFPGFELSQGVWQFPNYTRHNHYRGGWDATLGNGLSFMVRYIVTKGVDTLPDGTNIGGVGLGQGDGWRFSCLAQLRTCRVHADTYLTPGMFAYWLWQHFGDGVGDRYTRAMFGEYHGDVWEQAVGLRGAHLFNMFFLSTVLDDTPIGRASGLEWPENPVPQKLPGVRSQMHELALGSTGVYFAPYSGPQIVRISGVRPGTSYVLDLEFLSSTRTAVTIVRP